MIRVMVILDLLSKHCKAPTLRRKPSERRTPKMYSAQQTKSSTILYGDSLPSGNSWTRPIVLTPWGKVLVKIIASLKGKPELEEAAVIAVELLRLGVLTPDINMFPSYNGAPMRGSSKYRQSNLSIALFNISIAKDQNYNMLISRVAGLGTLRHKPIGFTGPLSQHLLGYNSVIDVVRRMLRDLVEVTSTHMFLTGCCNRHADLSPIATKYESPSSDCHLTCANINTDYRFSYQTTAH